MKRILAAAWPLSVIIGFAVAAAGNTLLPDSAVSALPCAVASAANPAPGAPADGPFLRNDTLFFCDRTEKADGFTVTTKVYVDPDPRSENRRRMREAASLMSVRNRRDLANNVRYLRRKHPGEFTRRDLQGLPAAWLPLVSVKGELYIDGGVESYPLYLTDSLFIEQSQDGPWPSIYTRFERPEAGRLQFRTNSPYPPEGDRAWDFYLIDPEQGIAVLAEHVGSQTRYRLLAAEERTGNFGLLVWECTELPAGDEVPRDTLDFRRMIANRYTELP